MGRAVIVLIEDSLVMESAVGYGERREDPWDLPQGPKTPD